MIWNTNEMTDEGRQKNKKKTAMNSDTKDNDLQKAREGMLRRAEKRKKLKPKEQ